MSWSQSGTPTTGPTPDADTFVGGSGEDIGIDGGLGDDSLVGGLGSDTIEGGGGFDFIYGSEPLGAADLDPGNLLTDTLDGGWIFGAEGNDTIQMTLAGTFSTALDIPNARIFAGAGNDLVQLSGNEAGFDPDVYGGTNDDTLIGTDVFSSLYGEDENDSLVGGSAGELLAGGEHNDTVDGSGGDDTIYGDDVDGGGSGNDSLNGGAGNDTIFGGDGDDTINGGSLGWDSMIGGEGINTLDFSDANGPVSFHLAQREVYEDGNPTDSWPDTVDIFGPTKDWEYIEGFTVAYGSQFNDGFMAGSEVADSIFGQSGDDVIFGNTGDDSLYGELDDDTIVGEEGSDFLAGGDGNDYLVGSRADLNTFIPEDGTDPSGNDTLEGGTGSDTAAGGAGDDVITDEADGGLFLGGDGNDSIVITASGSGTVEALGDAGDDTLIAQGLGLGDPLGGTLLGVSLDGGAGNDSIIGSDAEDFLSGAGDNDTILAGGGNDTVDAGAGNDIVTWRIGDGLDSLVGGDGTDVLDLEGWTPGGNENWTFTVTGIDTVFEHIPTGSLITAREFESITCFAPGTHILTARGEVPVERLRAGDLVVAPGRGAPLKPVRWVGRTRVDIAGHRDKRKVAPVVIRAGALGAGVPARDLRVSPEHAFLLQGRLVPAQLLVNGTTIVQETWHRAMTYWHVELEEHGVLVAEGALAESYFDDGNRHLFDNNVFAVQADFGAQRKGGRYAAEAFAPPVLDPDDPALARIRARLPGAEAAARSA